MSRRLTVAALVLTALFLLAACNTIEGFGRDLGKAGEKIEDAAN